MNHKKHIILCADDFGQDAGVSQGILQLVRANRLSAVSCMVTTPDFRAHAPALLTHKNDIQTGLHFNLTEGRLLSAPQKNGFSLKDVLIKSHLRWLRPSLIAREFHAQLDTFIEVMGEIPDFIDGHQHVHQFPVVRQVLLQEYQTRFTHKKPYIRATYPTLTVPQYRFKSMVLAKTGGSALSTALRQQQIPHNRSFSGVYDFTQTDYRTLFRQWLAMAQEHTLIMCHPGANPSVADPIARTRPGELFYLLSTEFLRDCQEFGVILTPKNAIK